MRFRVEGLTYDKLEHAIVVCQRFTERYRRPITVYERMIHDGKEFWERVHTEKPRQKS